MSASTEDGFVHRGIVEGFYGPPFADEDRLWLIERLGSWGMNRYLYAPKDDPLHRESWRESYSNERMDAFGQWISHGGKCGVEVGFALSPGLSIQYSSADDVATLAAKFSAFRDRGARFFSLALDDVPSELQHAIDRNAFRSLAAAHVAIAHALQESLGDDATLWLVPTDYLGVESTEYLEELGSDLDSRVEVGWTGRTVLSPTIELDEANRRAETLRRRLLVWDNYPADDGPMRSMLHLGPYRGRDPGLASELSGILLNPMQWARASGIALRTAARYLEDPQGYEPEPAWQEAIDEIGAGAPAALRVFAAAHRFSSLASSDCDCDRDLERAIAEIEGNPNASLASMDSLLREREEAPKLLRSALRDPRLRAEIDPWVDSHARESERMRAALDCLEVQRSDASALQKLLSYFRMEGRLTRLPPLAQTSYGPRRVLYPQLTSMHEHAAELTPGSLFRDRCLSDRLLAQASRS